MFPRNSTSFCILLLETMQFFFVFSSTFLSLFFFVLICISCRGDKTGDPYKLQAWLSSENGGLMGNPAVFCLSFLLLLLFMFEGKSCVCTNIFNLFLNFFFFNWCVWFARMNRFLLGYSHWCLFISLFR